MQEEVALARVRTVEVDVDTAHRGTQIVMMGVTMANIGVVQLELLQVPIE